MTTKRVGGGITKSQLVTAYIETFQTPSGQIVLADILRRAHMFESTFVPGDPYTSAFREGERNLGLAIAAFAEKNYEDVKKLAENQKIYGINENYGDEDS